jgi:predicted transcriptional regulator
VLDKMLRLRVRAFLVTRAQQVVGLISFEDIKQGRGTHCNANRVADVMIDASHVPLIDWQTVLYATVSDLLQIFDSTHANHLVVVDAEGSAFTHVRGLVYRRQLVGQLGVFPILDRGMELALAHCAAGAPGAISGEPNILSGFSRLSVNLA